MRTCHASWIKSSTSNRTTCAFTRVLPVPGSFGSSVRLSYPYPNCKFCKTIIPLPGVRVQHLLYPPGTSVSSVRPCHNTRSFWKFCNTFILVPETSGSYVSLPYPYPESTNPTEHNLALLCFFQPTPQQCPCLLSVTGDPRRGCPTLLVFT